MTNNKTLVIILLLVMLFGGAFLFLKNPAIEEISNQEPETQSPGNESADQSPGTNPTPSASPSPSLSVKNPNPQPSAPPPVSQPTTKQTTGRLLLSITDDTAPLDGISSILVTFSGIKAWNNVRGWITISSTPHTYDLLKLKQEGKQELILDTTVPANTYSEMILIIDSAVIVKNGIANTAKLPSSTVDFPISLPLRQGQTAAIELDFVADKSLHISSAGRYIFAPVIGVNVLGEIQLVQKSGSKVEYFNGLPKFAGNYGMNEIGAMQKNSSGIDSLSHIEIERDIFILIPQSLNRSLFIVTPSNAIDTALNSGSIAHVWAVYAEILEKKPMWRVYGATANSNIATVYVNAETGSVEKVQ